MMRSFVVALASIAVVSGYGSFDGLRAQTPAAAQQLSFPIDIAGGTPGVTVEIFLNAGKSGEVTINSTGGANWVLDASNMGKTRVQIYIDVCKDGKIVKVLFVTGGEPPPKDEDCDRRLAAAGFQSDCGVTRITIDLRAFGARVIGCGSPFTRPQVYGPIAGGAVLLGLLAGGGGSDIPALAATPFVPLPPTNTTVAAPPPATPPPTTPATFTITLVTSFTHPAGSNFSLVCGLIVTNPTQPGGNFTVQLSGPSVVPNQNISGVLNPNGQAAFQGRIQQVGSYTANVSVRSTTNVQSTATGMVNVTGGNSTCPTAQ